jgi:hypothetical protein
MQQIFIENVHSGFNVVCLRESAAAWKLDIGNWALDINVMTLQLLLKGNYVPAEILELFEDFTLFRVSMSNVQCPMTTLIPDSLLDRFHEQVA